MRGMVILFLTLTITFALEFCHLGIKMKKKNENHLILLISPMANYPCECDGKSKALELITKYLIQGVSLQLKNGWVEVLELAGALTTVFCKISVRKSKRGLEFSIGLGRLDISRCPSHYAKCSKLCLINFLRFPELKSHIKSHIKIPIRYM